MNRLVRDLLVITLRTSLMTVGVFLLTYGLLTLLVQDERLSVGLAAFGGVVVFGLLLSLPFSLPLALAGVAARIAYNRFAREAIPSMSIRSWILVLVIAGLGLLTIWLWLTVQGFEDMSAELESALYIAGAAGGGMAGYSAANAGRRRNGREG